MTSELIGNLFLASLTPPARDRVLAACRPMELPVGERLYDDKERPPHVWFLTTGIASVVFASERGTTIELETVGCEGMLGALSCFGDRQAMGCCEMQLAGSGLRMPAEAFAAELRHSEEVRSRTLEFLQHQMKLAFQILACNRLHKAKARFARWLLMVQDRQPGDVLPMTQQFLADMLGTRRTTVTEVAGELQRAGAIEYRRGIIRIVNRTVLERAACECYPLLKARFDGLYGRSVQPDRSAGRGGS